MASAEEPARLCYTCALQKRRTQSIWLRIAKAAETIDLWTTWQLLWHRDCKHPVMCIGKEKVLFRCCCLLFGRVGGRERQTVWVHGGGSWRERPTKCWIKIIILSSTIIRPRKITHFLYFNTMTWSAQTEGPKSVSKTRELYFQVIKTWWHTMVRSRKEQENKALR